MRRAGLILLAGVIAVATTAAVTTDGPGPPPKVQKAGRAANDSDCFYDIGFGRPAHEPRHARKRRLFARRSIWNTPIPRRATLDRGSRRMARQLYREVRDQYTRGVGPWLDRGPYSTPLYKVKRDQPRVKVALDYSSNACRLSLVRAFASVPLPRRARPASGTDQHLTLWQPSSDTMWEFWRLRREADGWHAGNGGAIQGVSTSPGHYTADSWPGVHTDWGATASGLPVIGGTMTPKEMRSGRIPHALALNLPLARAGISAYPALKTDGRGVGRGYIPEGAQLRLDPRVDVSTLNAPPLVKAMARAAQRYGIYVRDQTRAGAMFFALDVSATNRRAYRGRSDPLRGTQPHKVLISFPWKRLQVMKIRPRAKPRYVYPRRPFSADGTSRG